MVAGLLRGLDHEQAARFSFLLATPIILGAGVYKLPDLAGPLGDGIRGQALVGSIAAFVARAGLGEVPGALLRDPQPHAVRDLLRALRRRLRDLFQLSAPAGRCVAEADGNRTRQTEILGLYGVEDRAGHQAGYASAREANDAARRPRTPLPLSMIVIG